MRVTGGYLKNHQIIDPVSGPTHPMSDKIRSAIFNTLGDISGFRVLDAFAGTGALAIESISRGAKFAYTIDNNKKAYLNIAKNISLLGLIKETRNVKANIKTWLDNYKDQGFDLVFADPPYGDETSYHALFGDVVNEGGILVYSQPKAMDLVQIDNFDLVRSKTYSRARITFYKKQRNS
jgi:16S rRNA (guanine966-N2)-methyltransferase